MNPILLTDSYKLTHWKQYPPNTTRIYSYFESRGGAYPMTCFFGLQSILRRHLQQPITYADVDGASYIAERHFGDATLFNYDGFNHIVKDHGGKWPVVIKAVDEGSWVATRNALMTIENTCDKCFWVPNFLETLLVQVWYPTTVCTRSGYVKACIKAHLNLSADDLSALPTRLHDFGFRGASSVASARLGGTAHLVHFLGTDTLAALETARLDYHAGAAAGISIPAYEHSTVTSWGREHEADVYADALQKYPQGYVAVVSDSYDIFNATANIWGKDLRAAVLGRKGVLVVRPDSGDPETVVQGVLARLEDAFGSHTNYMGFRVLDSHVRVIQGDGMSPETIEALLASIEDAYYSADNVAFGMGGGLVQDLNRDTCKFAFKCSAAKVDGEWRDVYKEPITDPGKNSKRGRFKLAWLDTADGDHVWATVALDSPAYDELHEVYRDGVLAEPQTFDMIRARADAELPPPLVPVVHPHR
jgi:nicotinamide phosphoribosyltransferase